MKLQLKLLICLFSVTASLFSGECGMEEMLGNNPFFIEKEKVDAITTRYGITVHQLLQDLIPVAKKYARPPISNYHVGVSALGKSGNIYLGVNLEFLGMPLNEAVHGEQFLVVNARSHGEKELVAIATSAAPCGHCRQFLHEMGGEDNILVITPNMPTQPLSKLLPSAFGPRDLGLEATLMIPSENSSNLEGQDKLTEKALQAAYSSYAPYSQSKSGVAILAKDGTIYTGSYLENAAFNPSLSPLQAALVNLVAGMKGYNEIAHVVLAEQTNGKVSQEVMSAHITHSIAPQAFFEIIRY